jgi:hypothetical protein
MMVEVRRNRAQTITENPRTIKNKVRIFQEIPSFHRANIIVAVKAPLVENRFVSSHFLADSKTSHFNFESDYWTIYRLDSLPPPRHFHLRFATIATAFNYITLYNN